MFNKSMALLLGLTFLTGSIIALDQKVQQALIEIATYLNEVAAASQDAKLIELGKAAFEAAKKGDLQIPKPARAPKPDEQKSIDGAMKNYEKALVEYADALRASKVNKADAGLKSKAGLAQGMVSAAEKVLGDMIAAIK